jgi:hypothetical protein
VRRNFSPFTRIFLRTLEDLFRETDFVSIFEDLKNLEGSAP